MVILAQLNNLLVTGSSRFLNKIQGTASNADLASTADLGKRRIFIQGTQTTATTTGLWTGDASPYFNSAADLVDGQEITYWLPLPTTGNATLNLKFGDGTSSGAVNCYYGNTSRLTTHYGQGNAIHLTYRKNVKIPSTGSTTYTGWWADANYDSNSNNIDILQGTYTIPVAGATAGLKQYSLFAEDANGKYSSFTTQNGTAVSKTVNRTDYFDISKIYYCSTGGNYATNANIGTSIVRWAQPLVDLRYTLNISTSSLTARKPLYLVFDKTATTSNAIGDTLYKLAGTGTTDWWTQTLPTSADGKIYAEISKAVYDGYRGDLSVAHKYYEYTDKLHDYDSISTLKHTELLCEFFSFDNTLTCDTDFVLLNRTTIENIKGVYYWTNSDMSEIYSASSKSVNYYEGETEGDITYIFNFDDITLKYTSTGISIINQANFTNGSYAYAEGSGTTASGYCSHAEGYDTVASSTAAHAEGYQTTACNNYAHAEGYLTMSTGYASHTEGDRTTASKGYAHAEGQKTSATNTCSHAEGALTTASGKCAHAEGSNNIASSQSSHVEGDSCTASALYAHAEGYASKASGQYSHAEGYKSTADASGAHSEGWQNIASQNAAHAEGYTTTASGWHSHTEGCNTIASGWESHAEGYATSAASTAAHAGGYYTIANADYQTAIGKYNSTVADALFIVGKGTATDARSNAMYVTTAGNAVLAGGLTINNSTTAIDVGTRLIPKPPTTNGTYILQCVVSGGSATYSWETLASVTSRQW